MIPLTIAGGVALILFGIGFLRKGLERLMGFGLHAWLERMGSRPWKAAVAGTAFGTIAPSSTAQTLLTLQLLNAGRLPAESILGFLLGASVGITVTIQLIAFRLSEFYSVLLVVGLGAFQFFRSETVRGVGQTILGMGFILLGMVIISDAGARLAANADFMTVLAVLVNHPGLLLVFAAGLTFCTQSSTSAIELGLALGETKMGSMELLAPFVLGANLGIGLTSLAAGLPTWEGRRLAAANLVLKCAAIGLVLAFLGPLEALLARTGWSLARQTANLHTAFNVVVAAAGVLLGAPIGRLMRRAVPPSGGDLPEVKRPASHLAPDALSTPSLALANAARETLRLADEVKEMFEAGWRSFVDQDEAAAKRLRAVDEHIDEMNAAIKAYLSQIPSEAMSPRDSRIQFGLLNFASQLECIGDIVDKNLCGLSARMGVRGTHLGAEDMAVLQALAQRVAKRMEGAISVLATRDRRLAKTFLSDGESLKDWCVQIQKDHYQRLSAGGNKDVASSELFIEVMNLLRRISGQLNTVGHTFAGRSKP